MSELRRFFKNESFDNAMWIVDGYYKKFRDQIHTEVEEYLTSFIPMETITVGGLQLFDSDDIQYSVDGFETSSHTSPLGYVVIGCSDEKITLVHLISGKVIIIGGANVTESGVMDIVTWGDDLPITTENVERSAQDGYPSMNSFFESLLNGKVDLD